ncbi:MAG: hypothetical protein FJZ90_00975 [Chloroflexi bacterium]|nr:hypothetical protein [Chloroflexota bacterium]
MSVGWLTVPMAIVAFAAVAVGLYRIGGRAAARGEPLEAKHLPYACGEDLSPEQVQLSYKRFFRLALMFVVVHMAALVVAMLPLALDTRVLATLYLLGVAVCVDVLVQGEE